jgi:hypothetical protein
MSQREREEKVRVDDGSLSSLLAISHDEEAICCGL